jgi:hypothetical protein
VRSYAEGLGELAGIRPALLASALHLGQVIDRGAKGMGAAALARELRETLGALKGAADAGDAQSELGAFLSEAVPAEVGDTAESAPGDAGAEGGCGGEAAGDAADALAAARRRRRAGG